MIRSKRMPEIAKTAFQELLEDTREEYELTQRQLKEIDILIQQSNSEVEKFAQRNAQQTNRIRQLQANFDTVPREDIRAAYEALQDIERRLFTMRGQLEKLQSDQRNLEKYAEALRRLLDVTGTMLPGEVEGEEGQNYGMPAAMVMEGPPLIVRIVEAQEAERQRLSRQMHDGPAQSLTNFILQAEICSRLFDTDATRAKVELTNLKGAATQTFQKVRDFIFELRPMMLDDLGLVPTLRRYVEQFAEKSGIPTTLTVTGTERRLAPYIEVTMFRVIQELLTNARNHAQPSRIQVAVDMGQVKIHGTCDDDGSGFDVEAALSGAQGRKTIGLATMKERIGMLGGDLHIESGIGRGTRVTMELPATAPEG
jgi:two-component system sensor histidine kinase DegS